jgi:cold shock protein
MPLGAVKWFDQRKGFGFITDLEGHDLFVHFTNINPDIRGRLKPGQAVSFEVVPGEKGPKAVNLDIVEDPQPAT